MQADADGKQLCDAGSIFFIEARRIVNMTCIVAARRLHSDLYLHLEKVIRDGVAILVYIGFRYNAPTRFRYIHIYIHRI